MAENDDTAALQRVDPVDPASLPTAHGPAARALFERIIMTNATTESLPAPPPPQPPRRRLWLVATAAACLVVLGGIIALSATGDDAPLREVADPPTTSSDVVTPGESVGASCVEIYDLTTLANREIAFDGSVETVSGDHVTFTVNDWYRGGTDGEVTLAGASSLSGLTSAGGATSLEPGTRLLVAGDGGFAWSCGFTQPHDEQVARDWRRVLGG